jgi:hypothetical protein
VVRYDTLENHYRTIFSFVQDHGWSYSDIECMVPYDRDVMVLLLDQWAEERKKELQQRQAT